MSFICPEFGSANNRYPLPLDDVTWTRDDGFVIPSRPLTRVCIQVAIRPLLQLPGRIMSGGKVPVNCRSAENQVEGQLADPTKAHYRPNIDSPFNLQHRQKKCILVLENETKCHFGLYGQIGKTQGYPRRRRPLVYQAGGERRGG